MNWTKEQYAEYKNRRSLPRSEPQQAVCDEPVAEAQRETKYPSRTFVRITAFRRRLLDPDNLCPKYFIDGIRYAGLIPNDRPQDIILEVRQEKSNDERTEIELTTP